MKKSIVIYVLERELRIQQEHLRYKNSYLSRNFDQKSKENALSFFDQTEKNIDELTLAITKYKNETE